MRLIVMGTGPFALPSFRALLASTHQVLALVTKPETHSGRRKDSANPMRDQAVTSGIEVLEPKSINDPVWIVQLRERRADLFVVCDYGQILTAESLSSARLGGINLHGSLLPKYRGAAPVHWAIFHGEPVTGVSVIHMTPRLDGGPILSKLETPIGPDETTQDLEPRLAELGVPAVMQAIEMLEGWDGISEIGERQDTSQATRAPRLKKEQALIRWSESATQIRNQIRAFNPWPGSHTHVPRNLGEPLRVIIHSADVVENAWEAAPGTIVVADNERWVVTCGEQALSLRTVQPAGKRKMAINEFLQGYSIPVGRQLV